MACVGPSRLQAACNHSCSIRSGAMGDICCAAGISQTLSAAKGELYRESNQEAQQNITWVNYTALEPNACPPILCKVRALTTAACQAYKVSAVLLLI